MKNKDKIKFCAILNALIASRNLMKDGKRYINAHFGGGSNIKGEICVTELCTENHIPFSSGGFSDGYGYPVHFEAIAAKAGIKLLPVE